MADESEEEKKGSNKLLIIILIAVIVLLLGAGGAYFMLAGGDSKPAAEGEAGGEEGAETAEDGAAPFDPTSLGEIIELDPFVINLSSEGGSERYLKAVMVLQVSSPKVSEEVTKRAPQIKDSIITVLSSKTPEEALSIQGKYDLKVELIRRINEVLTSGVVRELYFTEFVIQ